jgi:aryl-alcohol dehydrogenase-like predicted oxidoreductase
MRARDRPARITGWTYGMLRRQLGTTGMEISSIGLGTWAVGGHMWGGQEDKDSIAAVHAALDHGVNWIDTAPIYGSGRSETVIGQAIGRLPASRRPLIFTKFGLGVVSEKPERSATYEQVIAECDASLQRLGVDRIDLYQLHWPVEHQPMADTAAACDHLLKAGKIRAIGVSNFSVAQLQEWQSTGVPLHSLQSPFSILRPAIRHDQLPWCAGHHVGVIAYSPLFRGLLFGTWTREKTFPADDSRGAHKDYSGPRFQRHMDALDELKSLAGASGLSLPQLCVGVLLHEPGLTGCIVGARDARQGSLIANLAVTITDEQANAVWSIATRLAKDLETIPAGVK